MAQQECSDSTSLAISASSTSQNLWDLDLHHHHRHHHATTSSWTTTTTTCNWHHVANPSSNSSCDDQDVSISTSGLTIDSSRQLPDPSSSNDLNMPQHSSDTHLWTQILLGVGSNGGLESSEDLGENLLDTLSSKGMSRGIFDYLKKMDTNWEFTGSSVPVTNFDKHLNGFDSGNLIENERLSKLSNLVSNWSIAPPDPQVSCHQFNALPCNMSLGSSGNDCSQAQQPRRSINSDDVGYYVGLNSSATMVGDNMINGVKYYHGMPQDSCTSARNNFADVMTFNSRFNEPLIDVQVPKPCFKSLNLSDCRKNTLTGRGGHGNMNEGKKKRSEEASKIVLKKPKHETSTISSAKAQTPKVKLGDRITALQQIVSPFGRTDTASVLLEAIQYIKFLQQQVQLLSNPYLKTNSHKDVWGGMEIRKDDMGYGKVVDLRSRGLCLVPISCTPKVYHDNTASDYWTPTYRGCLYR